MEPSDSQWASPLVPVVKPNGTVRLCVDFRRLNEATPQLQTYIPQLDDIFGASRTVPGFVKTRFM